VGGQRGDDCGHAHGHTGDCGCGDGIGSGGWDTDSPAGSHGSNTCGLDRSTSGDTGGCNWNNAGRISNTTNGISNSAGCFSDTAHRIGHTGCFCSNHCVSCDHTCTPRSRGCYSNRVSDKPSPDGGISGRNSGNSDTYGHHDDNYGRSDNGFGRNGGGPSRNNRNRGIGNGDDNDRSGWHA
jgi:hypothetical protein